MIWAKRGAAVVVAAGLIVGAVVLRTEVIEGDDDGTSDDTEATTLVCLTELKPLCDAVTAAHPELMVRVETATRTSDAWATADRAPDELWLTMAPLPDAVELRRASTRGGPLGLSVQTVAASRLALVVPTAKAADLRARCTNLDWACVGQQAGTEWASGGTVRPAFAPIHTGIGQIGIAAAVRGYFGDRSISAEDPDFISWSRRLHRVADGVQLSTGTAIATIQVRPSALDVAIGAEQELANGRRSAFEVLYAAPMTSVELVLAAPSGIGIPGAVLDDLTRAATENGWELTSSVIGEPPTASDLLATTAAWEAP